MFLHPYCMQNTLMLQELTVGDFVLLGTYFIQLMVPLGKPFSNCLISTTVKAQTM